MREHLKNCPFCGGEPKIFDCRTYWYVNCQKCGATVYGEHCPDIDNCDTDAEAEALVASIDWDAVYQSAVNAWNRRVKND